MLYNAGMGKDIFSGVRVPYLDELERLNYLVTVQDGLLYRRGTKLMTANESWAFVMDKDGEIYCGRKSGDVEHHSAFLSGRPVAAAGHIRVVAGKLLYVNNSSGHYQPTKEYMLQFKKELVKQGVDFSSVRLEFGISSRQLEKGLKRISDPSYQGRWFQRFHAEKVIETVDGAGTVETGRSHFNGQLRRLYPEGPRWQWH
ncbi:hypothetical protein [Pelagibaculum spongiae]|uniref:hypothetical protein n=1 Tax=Pelagibaculum spongiae TaxID=2080658 RepID=UPI0015B1D810|nr:hypothetical protein [Pelagibaculum spongiae]